MAGKCVLGDFRLIRPTYTADHRASLQWLSQAHAQSEAVTQVGTVFDKEGFRQSMEKFIARYGCSPENLARRGHDLEDILHRDWSAMRIFNLEKDPAGAGMEARMELFAEVADRAADGFYLGAGEPPDEIIHVTCTGYTAPSAVQKLVSRRGWHEKVGVTHAYHMGCYAAMPAVKIATGYLASRPASSARVDILHTEMCTLHLDPSRHEPEQLVVQSLFSDGHIRYSVRPEASDRPGLEFLAVHEELVPDSLDAMEWNLGDRGMRMTLARNVPDLIASSLRSFLLRLLSKAGQEPAEVLRNGIFAVHPGGPRIIDKVAEMLELAPARVEASRGILRDYGNMSSATLPHIWSRILADAAVPSGALIVSLAFGPGLTIYGALLRKL